jgi:hypothetical protein
METCKRQPIEIAESKRFGDHLKSHHKPYRNCQMKGLRGQPTDLPYTSHSMLNSSLVAPLVKSQAGYALIRRQVVVRTRSLLRKVTSFAATMGLIAAIVAGQSHYVSAANRGELWFSAEALLDNKCAN